MNPKGETHIAHTVPPRIRRGFDLAAGLFTAQLIWTYVAYSQRSLLSFGPYVEISTPEPPSAVVVVASRLTPLSTILVGSKQKTGLDRYRFTPGGRLVRDGNLPTSTSTAMMTSTDVNGDGIGELVILSPDGQQVEILRPEQGTHRRQQFRLEHRAQRFVTADINNDGRKDLLFFGRNMSGVEPWLGAPDGRFTPGRLLFPEISAGDLVATDLNGDRITDVVLLHWLSDCLVVQFGVGNGLFSEQVTLRLPSEPGRMTFMRVENRRILRFLVTMPELNAVAHVIGTPAGEFSIKETIDMPARPLAVSFSLINDDQLPDMVVSTPAGMTVALGRSSTTFMPLTQFGTGAESVSWSLDDIDGDRKTDLVIADHKRNKIIVLGNAQHSSFVAWPTEYAAGVQPRMLGIGDCTNDGFDDLLVANAGSSSISIFASTGTGAFLGQRAVSVPEKPGPLKIVRAGESTGSTVVSVHPALGQIGITRFSRTFERSRLLTVPTESRPALLLAEADPATHRLRILVRNAQNGGSRAPLTLYEEIGGEQFLERTYRSTLPTTITAMTIGDMTANMKNDLVLALRDRSTRVSMLCIAPADADYDFKTIEPLFTLPDTTTTVRYLWTGTLNGDAHTDLLLYLSQPQPALRIAYGLEDGSLSLDSTWTAGIHLAHEDALSLRDVDNDGDTDIVYLDAERDAVYCMYGIHGGRYTPPQLVIKAHGAEFFAIGTGDPVSGSSIVLSFPSRHTVSFHRGLFGR